MRISVVLILLCTVFCSVAFSATIHVPGDQPTIQAAVDAAVSYDLILVAPGTYSGAGNTDIQVIDKWVDIESENGSAETIIDCENQCRAIHYSEAGICDLQGFTFIGGNADFGGSLMIEHSCVYISECIFRENHAEIGGAIYRVASTPPIPSVSDCEFYENSASLGGGAICINCYTNMEHCLFSGNHSEGSGGAIHGYTFDVRRSVFEFNSAFLVGGAIACTSAIIGSSGSGNSFVSNHAGCGADIGCPNSGEYSPAQIEGNHFAGNYTSEFYVAPQSDFEFNDNSCDLNLIDSDLYVRPDGDDSSDGLSWETAFRTIQHALSVIQVNPDVSHTVQIGAGTFAPQTSGEVYPLPILSNVYLDGKSPEKTILDSDRRSLIMYGYSIQNALISNLAFHNGLAHFGGAVRMGSCGLCKDDQYPRFMNCDFFQNEADQGGAIYAYLAKFSMISCNFEQNISHGSGGGIWLQQGSPVLQDCRIIANLAVETGGGIYHWDYDGPQLFNCLIARNSASSGGGIFCMESTSISNCTITSNTAESGAGGFSFQGYYAPAILLNSIIWGNQLPDCAFQGESECTVTHCDIGGGYSGTGNFDLDPLLTGDISREYCLSQIASGQAVDSPCLNSGSAPASQICFDPETMNQCLDSFSTRTDGGSDEGTADIGFHHPSLQVSPTPTPSLTPIPSSTPTFPDTPTTTPTRDETPTPTVTMTPLEDCSIHGCRIFMPEHFFEAGDPCYCYVTVCNTHPYELKAMRLFVVLEVLGSYFCAPHFTGFDYFEMNLQHGLTQQIILDSFVWPSNAGVMNGIYWYAGLTSQDMTTVEGEIDTFEFGWN